MIHASQSFRILLPRIRPMAALYSLKLPPTRVVSPPCILCIRNSPGFSLALAHEGLCRLRTSVRSFSTGAVRSISCRAMGGEAAVQLEEEKEKEKEVASASGNVEDRDLLVVISFYKFANLPDYEEKRALLKELCESRFVSGGIILAPEGINGSICGTREAVEAVMSAIQSDERLVNIRRTEAPAGVDDEEIHHGHTGKSPLGAGENAPFRWDHVRVKLKKEVVSMGLPGVNPAEKVGKYVKPKDWNKLISDPNTVVVDVRNSYEIRVGKFRRAVDPGTDSFREFPAWVSKNLGDGSETCNPRTLVGEQLEEHMTTKHKEAVQVLPSRDETERKSPRRIAMYCTGGIRCEKATSYLVNQGFDEVHHLEGGILKYLEETPASESLWEGECFVFDKRVSVGHSLEQGSYRLCYACKKPVNSTDMESPLWEDGVSCPYCYHEKSEAEKTRARARHDQYLHWGIIGGPKKGRPKPSVSKQRRLEYPERERYFSVKSE